MKRIAFSVLLLLTSTLAWSQDNPEPRPPIIDTTTANAQRSVEGNVVTSEVLPAVRLEMEPAFTYLGGQDFILYGVANAEQHFFAELDGKRVKRLLWIQFEGYLEDNDHTYDYSRYPVIELDGHPFHHNSAFKQISETEARPDSDGARAYAFLAENGYPIGPEVMFQRLVWLLDNPARNELMFIYMEDLADHGLTAGDLGPEGEATDRWEELAEGLLERAVASVRLSGN